MLTRYAYALTALMMTLALTAAAQDEPKDDGPKNDKPAVVDAATQEKIDTLIAQLGDRKYAVREQATKALIALGKPALKALREAAKDDDIEVRQRAQRAIDTITGVDKPKPKKVDAPRGGLIPLGPGGGKRAVRIVMMGPGGKQVSVDETDGVKTLTVTEAGKTKTFVRKKDGSFEVTAAGKTHKFKTADAFKKGQPKLFAEWQANKDGGPQIKLIRGLGGGGMPPALQKKIQDALRKQMGGGVVPVPPKPVRPAGPLTKGTKKAETPQHGALATELGGALASHLGREGGALVTKVTGDLAGKLGLKVHDVVTKIGETTIASPEELYAALSKLAKDTPESVTLSLVRGGKVVETDVALGK